MTQLTHGPIKQIPTTSPTAYAFRITGRVDDDASEALAKFMLKAFDKHDEKVDILLDMTAFTGSDWDAIFDSDVIASRFRALSEVRHYAVIGAPDRAAKMIGWMDKVIAVKAKAFDTSERAKAWAFIGASEADTASRIRSA